MKKETNPGPKVAVTKKSTAQSKKYNRLSSMLSSMLISSITSSRHWKCEESEGQPNTKQNCKTTNQGRTSNCTISGPKVAVSKNQEEYRALENIYNLLSSTRKYHKLAELKV